MGERRRDRLHSEMADDFVVLLVASTLPVYQTNVHGDSSAGAMLTTLPPVAEAKGKIYNFLFTVDGGDWTIDDYGDTHASFAILTLTAVGDHVSLTSDGTMWHVLHDTTTE